MRRRGDPLDDFDSDEDWLLIISLILEHFTLYNRIENVEFEGLEQDYRNTYEGILVMIQV